MNCREIEPLLSALLDNELTIAERHLVQRHLQDCSICWRTLAAFQSFNTATLAILPTRVGARPAARRPWPIVTVLPRVGAAVLATIALSGSAVLGWLVLNNRPATGPMAGTGGRAEPTVMEPGLPSQVAANERFFGLGAGATGAGTTSPLMGPTTVSETVTDPQTLDRLASAIGDIAAGRPNPAVTASDRTIDSLAGAIGSALAGGRGPLTAGAPSATPPGAVDNPPISNSGVQQPANSAASPPSGNSTALAVTGQGGSAATAVPPATSQGGQVAPPAYPSAEGAQPSSPGAIPAPESPSVPGQPGVAIQVPVPGATQTATTPRPLPVPGPITANPAPPTPEPEEPVVIAGALPSTPATPMAPAPTVAPTQAPPTRTPTPTPGSPVPATPQPTVVPAPSIPAAPSRQSPIAKPTKPPVETPTPTKRPVATSVPPSSPHSAPSPTAPPPAPATPEPKIPSPRSKGD